MNALPMLLMLALALVLTGCPQPTGCSSSTCQGCCDVRGVCQLGQSPSACGARGLLCTECGLGLTCATGACITENVGGNAGGSGVGGGQAVAGGSSTGQELVSGSRLRAVNHVGPDGSRAPAFFWDTQLAIPCIAQVVNDVGLCVPSYTASPLNISSGVWADPQCRLPAYLLFAVPIPGFAPSQIYGTDLDGGTRSWVSLSPASAYQLLIDGGCAPSTNPGLTSARVFSPGLPVAQSTFATMPLLRE